MEKKRANRVIFIWVTLFTIVLFSSNAFAIDTPKDLTQEVKMAIKNGKALYETYIKGPTVGDANLKEINEAKNNIKDFCNFNYNAYIINAPEGDAIYFIAEPPSKKQIVFGRHYKVIKEKVISSTVTCFVSPKMPDNAVAAFSTHLLSDAPTEFHVFLSLKHNTAIYVRTSRGTWKVESGKIEFIEPDKTAPVKHKP